MPKVSAKSLANLQPPWKAGEPSANPHGRPQGARSKLNELALRALLEDFSNHGPETIARVRERRPESYLSAVVSLLPRQAQKLETPFTDLSDTELEQLSDLLTALRAKTVNDLARVAPKKPKDILHNGNGSLGLEPLKPPGRPAEVQEDQGEQREEERPRGENGELLNGGDPSPVSQHCCSVWPDCSCGRED